MSSVTQNTGKKPGDWLFLVKIVMPTLAVIGLFYAATFQVLLPAFEDRILEDKRVMIRELTDAAWSILDEAEQAERAGRISRTEAQRQAVERVRGMRYGSEHKDYFWISDLTPRMVSHPYRPELDGTDLSSFKSQDGRYIFVEFAELVRQQGAGYVKYRWQWKDDQTRVVPKLSYVKGFAPWGWLVGTGIYLDDVERELAAIERRLIQVTLAILGLSAAMLGLVVYHGLQAERRRSRAEVELAVSHERYKALVGAAKEGILLFRGGACVFCNQNALTLFSCNDLEQLRHLPVLAGGSDQPAGSYFQAVQNGTLPEQLDLSLPKADGGSFTARLSCVPVQLGGEQGVAVFIQDASRSTSLRKRLLDEEHRQHINAELQSSLAVFSQPLAEFMVPVDFCAPETTLREAARRLAKAAAGALLVRDGNGLVVGIVTATDLACRGTVMPGLTQESPVARVMSAPLVQTTAATPVFEAFLLMHERQIGHLAVGAEKQQIIGLVNSRRLLELQCRLPFNLISHLRQATGVEQIAEAIQKLPLMVETLVSAGLRPRLVTKVAATASDAAHQRIIELALADLGEPPAPFSFLLLGSQGRLEETLCRDQDNALIFAEVEPARQEAVKAWFDRLATRVCEDLAGIGFPYCLGEVMAKNPRWTASLPQWQEYFSAWIAASEPEALRKINIFFDFRHLYGDPSLALALKQHIQERLPEYPSFFLHMANDNLLYRPPIGVFGGLALKKDGAGRQSLSLKEAVTPIVNFARLYALRHGLACTNTLDRLELLHEKNILNADSYALTVEVYELFMELRYRHQVQLLRDGRAPDNDLPEDSLSEIEMLAMKRAFQQIQDMQGRISFDFKGVN